MVKKISTSKLKSDMRKAERQAKKAVNDYNREVKKINRLIDDYNRDVKKVTRDYSASKQRLKILKENINYEH